MTTPAFSATPNRVIPSPLAAAWTEVSNATTVRTWPATQPAEGVNPFGASDTLILPNGLGAEVMVSLRAPQGITVSTPLQGYVIGRARGATGAQWEILQSRDGTALCELTMASTDAYCSPPDDYQRSTVNLAKHSFECRGCTEFAWVTRQALAGTGSVGLARVDLRPW